MKYALIATTVFAFGTIAMIILMPPLMWISSLWFNYWLGVPA